jgi:hypothetical protein
MLFVLVLTFITVYNKITLDSFRSFITALRCKAHLKNNLMLRLRYADMSKHVTLGIYWEPDRWVGETVRRRESWNSHQTGLDKLVTPGSRPQSNIMKEQRERFRRKKSKILEEGTQQRMSLHWVRIRWRQVGTLRRTGEWRKKIADREEKH